MHFSQQKNESICQLTQLLVKEFQE